jgi:catechol 2,3-dioxygenase-like lactoylglutathione lyase family enzyme
MADEAESGSPERAAEVGGVTPILRVSNLEASFRYYEEALGFTRQWEDGGFGCVQRGQASLMLCEGGQGHLGGWVWIGVSDAGALHEELAGRGATIRHPPTNYPWGSREVHISDPDGNVLRFGSDLAEGEPFGEWLDGDGVRWAPQADGSWRRVGSRL